MFQFPASNLAPQENVTEMIEEVKEAFKSRLEDKDWLDDTTKERCAEKVDAMIEMVAYPDQISNDTYLDELYALVSVQDYELQCVLLP